MENKSISIKAATATGLGAIIGSGIFVLSGTAIALAGANALIAFIIVGILAIIIALEMGELAAIMPYKKGSGYSYTYEAFGSQLGFITGVLLYFSFATSISVVTLGFGSYLYSMLGFGNPIIYAILEITALAVLNLKGIKKAIKADFWLVIIKVSILSLFIISAIVIALINKTVAISNFSSTSEQGTVEMIFAASIVVFFAYSGFQTITTFTSKIDGKAAGALKAIVWAVVISMVLYIAIVISMLVLAPSNTYKVSGDPLAFALKNAGAPEALTLLIDIGALIATTSAAIAMMLSSSRILYQIGVDGLLPKLFRKYDKSRDVATNNIMLSAFIAIIFLFAGNIYTITAISNFGLLFSYLMIGLSVIHFRRQKISKGFKTPLYPVLTVIATVLLLIFIMSMPQEALSIGVAILISLIVIYYIISEINKDKVIKIKLFK
ncbi:MAG: amino acid permease [Candidatus Micrarchaeaceae archaeon]